MDNMISIIGSVASIGSAIWAFTEARKSLRHATKAEEIKKELINRRVIVEVSRMHSETSRILKTVSLAGPTCTPSNLRGVDCNSIAKQVEEYVRFINEHISNFNEQFQVKARELCKNLTPNIEKLSEAKTFEEKKTPGKEIYHTINNFMPDIKQLADEKKENVKTA